MKTKFKSQQKLEKLGNKKYTIGSKQTPVGPSGVSVWLTEVSGIDTSQWHMVGIRRYNDDTLWVRDTDEGAQELIRDRDRMLEEEERNRKLYSEYLREQKHGKR